MIKIPGLRRLLPEGGEWSPWLKAAIIAVTLLAAAYIGLRAERRTALLLGLAPLAVLGFVLLVRRLPWGIVALVPVAFLIDLRIGTGTNVRFNATFLFVILLIGAWLVRMLVIEKQVRLAPSPVNMPALLFILAGLLAWLGSFLPWLPFASARPSLPAQLGAFLIYALSIGALLLAANLLDSLRLLKIFTWTYLAFGVVYMLAQVLTWDFNLVRTWFVDAHYGNSVYWTLLAALAMGQALFNRRLHLLLRAGLLGMALLVVVFSMLRRPEWVSGWLPPLLAVLFLLWLWNWRLGLGATIFAAIFLLPLLLNFYDTRVNSEVQQWSTFTRFATWSVVLDLLRLNPLTGLGPAVYPFYTSLYSYLGYYVSFNSHNNYFDIALQTGLLGLGIFIWLVVALFRTGWRLRRTASDGFTLGYVNGVLAGLAAVLVSGTFADWFMPFLYNIGIPGFQSSIFIWLFAGGLVALYRLTSSGQKEAGSG